VVTALSLHLGSMTASTESTGNRVGDRVTKVNGMLPSSDDVVRVHGGRGRLKMRHCPGSSSGEECCRGDRAEFARALAERSLATTSHGSKLQSRPALVLPLMMPTLVPDPSASTRRDMIALP
jgi:hypothetical protein